MTKIWIWIKPLTGAREPQMDCWCLINCRSFTVSSLTDVLKWLVASSKIIKTIRRKFGGTPKDGLWGVETDMSKLSWGSLKRRCVSSSSLWIAFNFKKWRLFFHVFPKSVNMIANPTHPNFQGVGTPRNPQRIWSNLHEFSGAGRERGRGRLLRSGGTLEAQVGGTKREFLHIVLPGKIVVK